MRTLRSHGLVVQILPVPVLLTVSGCGHSVADNLGQTTQSGIIGLTWFLGILALVFFIFIVITQFPRLRKSQAAPVPDQAAPAVAPQAPPKRPSEMNDEELFQHLKDLIQTEQLFLNPLLDRQVLISRLGVSAHRIGAAFSKGSEFHSLPGFIRSLRLEHARTLLISCPDLSVKAVGESSGFSNNSTFCSDFKTQYGITPSDYRQEKLSNLS